MNDRIAICYALLDATPPGTPVPFKCDADGNIGVRLLFEGSVPINGVANNVDNVAPAATANNLKVASYNYVFDGANWDRVYGYNLSSASVSATGNGAAPGVMAAQYFNSGGAGQFAPVPGGSMGGNIGNQSVPLAIQFVYAWNGGSSWTRVMSGNAANLATQASDGAQMVQGPGEWAINHAPAANTTATISKAAGGAGVRHVCKGFSVSINAVAAIAAPLTVNLRDGATGAGTILWTDRIMAPAGTTARLDRSGLNIVGSANTAMTLEFTAAPGATNFENVNLNGISTS